VEREREEGQTSIISKVSFIVSSMSPALWEREKKRRRGRREEQDIKEIGGDHLYPSHLPGHLSHSLLDLGKLEDAVKCEGMERWREEGLLIHCVHYLDTCWNASLDLDHRYEGGRENRDERERVHKSDRWIVAKPLKQSSFEFSPF
jgi:hypothetical protein